MSFPVIVIKPGAVAGTFYVPNTSKVQDAVNSAGTTVGPDEEIFLNGKPAKLTDDLMPPVTSPDKVEILKKSAPDTIITIIPKGSGA